MPAKTKIKVISTPSVLGYMINICIPNMNSAACNKLDCYHWHLMLTGAQTDEQTNTTLTPISPHVEAVTNKKPVKVHYNLHFERF